MKTIIAHGDALEGGDGLVGAAVIDHRTRFADSSAERRYMQDMALFMRKRLTLLCVALASITGLRVGATTLGLLHDPAIGRTILPSLAQVLLAGGALLAMRRPRPAHTVEICAIIFAALFMAARCWLLAAINPLSGAVALTGSVALMWFGLPVRLTALTIAMVTGSVAMFAVWYAHARDTVPAACLSVVEWLAMINLLGLATLRMIRVAVRRQWAMSQTLKHLATHDGLTGIANRRQHDGVLGAQWERCGREARPVSVIGMDVDFFKRLNDASGHAVGDVCLRELAVVLESCVPASRGLVARTGGEEFSCLLPDADPASARRIAEHIAAAVRARRIPHPDSTIGPHVTVSLGVATAWPAACNQRPRDIVALADRLVYAAKREGRNRIRHAVLGGDGVIIMDRSVA